MLFPISQGYVTAAVYFKFLHMQPHKVAILGSVFTEIDGYPCKNCVIVGLVICNFKYLKFCRSQFQFLVVWLPKFRETSFRSIRGKMHLEPSLVHIGRALYTSIAQRI